MVLKIPAWAQWKLWSLREAAGQKSKEIFFIFWVIRGVGASHPLLLSFLGCQDFFLIFRHVLKTGLKIHLAQIKKNSKIGLCILWKLSALASSCWIFPGCGRWRSWGQSQLAQSTLYGLKFDFCESKDLPPLDSWGFPSRLRSSPCAEEDGKHRHHSMIFKAPTIPVKMLDMELSGEGKSTIYPPWWKNETLVAL